MPMLKQIYELTFTTPLHMANEREDYAKGSTQVHSDTLYAALWFAMSRLGLHDLIPKSESANQTGFVISSLMPYYKKNNQVIRFLPRPLTSNQNSIDYHQDTKLKKAIKKTKWVDGAIFKELLTNEISEQFKSTNNINGAFWSSENINELKFVTSQIIPRAMVPRSDNSDTTIFLYTKILF